MVKIIITDIDTSESSFSDFITMVFLRNYLLEHSYICLKESFFVLLESRSVVRYFIQKFSKTENRLVDLEKKMAFFLIFSIMSGVLVQLQIF